MTLAAEVHKQLGPAVRIMMLSNIKDDDFKGQLEKRFDSNPFDATLSCINPPRKYLFKSEADDTDDSSSTGFAMDVPKIDILSTLPANINERLVSITMAMKQMY